MYAFGILVFCIAVVPAEIMAAVTSFMDGRIPLGIFQCVIITLLIILGIIILTIRDHCLDFELDPDQDDEPKVRTLKEAGGRVFAAVVILILVMWYCCLARII